MSEPQDPREGSHWPLCVYCGRPSPVLNLEGETLDFVLARNLWQGERLALGETKLWAGCTEEEARLFNEHVRECAYAWPFKEDDLAVLEQVDRAFANAPRPAHFSIPDTRHPDFEDTNAFLQKFIRHNLSPDFWLVSFTFWNAQAGAYYLPAVARFMLRPEAASLSIADGLLSTLHGRDLSWFDAFTPEQLRACQALLRHAFNRGLFGHNFEWQEARASEAIDRLLDP